jgi:hypothetical protein
LNQNPLVFLDTEFSSFEDPRLISVGLATTDGAALHVALAPDEKGWSRESCSGFVRAVVLPLIDTPLLERQQARDAVLAFLRRQSTASSIARIIVDFTGDWVLLRSLIDPLPDDLAGLEARLFASPKIEDYAWQGRRHHALVDAQALLWAWQQEQEGTLAVDVI